MSKSTEARPYITLTEKRQIIESIDTNILMKMIEISWISILKPERVKEYSPQQARKYLYSLTRLGYTANCGFMTAEFQKLLKLAKAKQKQENANVPTR